MTIHSLGTIFYIVFPVAILTTSASIMIIRIIPMGWVYFNAGQIKDELQALSRADLRYSDPLRTTANY